MSEKIRIKTNRDRPLVGDLHLPHSKADWLGSILIIHGFKGFKDWGFFPYLADRLAGAGLAALRFNLGGCGIREEGDFFDDPLGFETNSYSQELEETGCAVDRLRRETDARTGTPTIRIGLLGHSRGGATALLHASSDPTIHALVTWSAIAKIDRYGPEAIEAWKRGGSVPIINARTGQTFHLQGQFWQDIERNRERFDLKARAAELSIPWLILHGEVDETVPIIEAEELFAASGRRGGDDATELSRIPLTGHTFGVAHPFTGPTRPLETAVDRTIRWFSMHLGGPLDTDSTGPLA